MSQTSIFLARQRVGLRVRRLVRCLIGKVATLVLLTPAFLFAEGREFSVLSFNAWHDLTQVNDGPEKARAAILQSGADLVGLQESSPKTAGRLAESLGWHRAETGTGSVQILSRYPVLETISSDELSRDRLIGARVRLDESPRRELILFNAHLDYRHYGPYAAKEPEATAKSILAENQRSERGAQINAILKTMRPFLAKADSTPVVLTGDFNVPSHLDWTVATSAAHQEIGPVSWPESARLADAGLVDSFRTTNPDPAAAPGHTWSTIHKGSEPQDRIDFIYHKGADLHLTGSETFTTAVETTIGAWGTDQTPAATNTWPSDHAAVLSSYIFR